VLREGIVCVDAGLAFLWLVPDALTPQARVLRRTWFAEGTTIIAPPLFRPELTSAIRRWLYTGDIDDARARSALGRSLRLPVYLEDAGDALQLRAFDIATELNMPRAYDAQYIAIAEFHECALWTADRRLVNTARRKFRFVHWVGEPS
jgi:predicted nucleic acid-binding protein